MKKNYISLLSMLVLVSILAVVFYTMMPQSDALIEKPLAEFSTIRALTKVKQMTAKPHFVGSQNHEEVAQYLVSELQKLGLQPTIQEGFTMTEKGTLVKSKNILAKIDGSKPTKALLLLSHYDSAPHSYSLGASDDASGVAAILESVRAFLYSKAKNTNDIIILFTDAEELGLNGAALFVTKHKWAKQVGLALNFEARGSSGPSYMLMETNKGNAKMVEAFSQSNAKYPVSNSLMYSIYKMLPNDTDLTVFREKGKIQGFNFAFIDNHYNYHTAQDSYENLDTQSMAHQGSYLFPMMQYFANANLTNLNSKNDLVYFSVPFSFVSYPFSWIYPMLILAFILFFGLVFLGLGKQLLQINLILKGFLLFLVALLISGGITFYGWKLLLSIYPQYNDILQGFTYNGHDYIYAFVSLTLAICFLFYKKDQKRNPEFSYLIAPLFLWLIVNAFIATKLQGAAFLIIPVLSTLLILGYFVITQKSNIWFNLLLVIPTLVIIAPFIQMFPVGLGLKILAGSAVLTVLAFGLLLPILGNITNKNRWSFLFLLLSIGLFSKAHFSSDYEKGKAKPNSLLYVLNADTNQAFWTTYDTNLDDWTKGYLGENPKPATALNTNKLYSKYGSEFSFMAEAEVKPLTKPTIVFTYDNTIDGQRYLRIRITPNRKVNRYDIFANPNMKISNLVANGVSSIDIKSKISGKTESKLLSYYVVNNLPLELSFSIEANQKFDMSMNESSFDLLSNPLFSMAKRKKWMIPTPFVLNDAVVIKQKIIESPKIDEVVELN